MRFVFPAIVGADEVYQYPPCFDGLTPELLTECGASWHEIEVATASFFEELPIPGSNHVSGIDLIQKAADGLTGLKGQNHISHMLSLRPTALPDKMKRAL